jgi:uncharacterized membrane protein YkvA (DUF1232 family)
LLVSAARYFPAEKGLRIEKRQTGYIKTIYLYTNRGRSEKEAPQSFIYTMETQDKKGRNIADSGIFKKFLSRAEEYLKKPSRVKDLISDTYKKASAQKDVGTIAHEVWESLQTLTRLIKAAVSGEYTGIPTATIVGGIAVLLYFLSPIDLIPDFIPVIGLLDDVALLAWFMSSIKTEMDKFADWEKRAPQPAPATAAAEGGVPPQSDTIDPAPGSPKYNTYENTDPNNASPETQRAQAPGVAPGAGSEVKDFTAHDLEVTLSPDESAIRAAASGSGEPNVRAATTDSTRIPSSNDDDLKAGGNIR